MIQVDPFDMPKETLENIIRKISQADSPVDIDAKYTHAIIIAYLRQISKRLDKLETMIRS